MGAVDTEREAAVHSAAWRGPVAVAGALTLAVAVATLVVRAANPGIEPAGRNWWIVAGLVLGVAYVPVGVLVVVRSGPRAVGLVLTAVGACTALGTFAAVYAAAAADGGSLPGGGTAGALAGPLWLGGLALLVVALPLGLVPGPRPVTAAVLAVIGLIGLLASLPFELARTPGWGSPAPANPFDGPDWLEPIARIGRGMLAVAATGALVVLAQAWWRDRGGRDRALRSWVLAGHVVAYVAVVPLLVAPLVVSPFGREIPGEAVVLPLLLLTTVPLLGVGLLAVAARDGVWATDATTHRLLDWALLTSAIAVLYTVVVAGLGVLVGGSGPTWLLVAATGAVAAAAEPLRRWAHANVDHLLYGDRHDPLTVVRDVMQHVSSISDVDQLLPTLSSTVAESLRLDYVRIDVAGRDGREVGGAHGQPTTQTKELELRHHGVLVGWLIVGWSSGSSLRRGDEAALHDASEQLAHAASWVRLTADLRQAMVAIASAREEERRRLRRDLHDGLGPALTGISLGLRSAVKELDGLTDAAAPAALLALLADEIDGTVAEVKRIARDLRPTALDERDLCAAIGTFARRLDPTVRVHLDLPDDCPKLPAAVEVATYRIASEALTNVVRHAHADNCWLHMAVDGSVEIDVSDDGVGMSPGHPSGIGLEAMRERVSELGGTLAITDNQPSGTRVHVSLPAGTR